MEGHPLPGQAEGLLEEHLLLLRQAGLEKLQGALAGQKLLVLLDDELMRPEQALMDR